MNGTNGARRSNSTIGDQRNRLLGNHRPGQFRQKNTRDGALNLFTEVSERRTMEQNDLATVELFRFDPVVDSESRYSLFQVPYKGYTVMNVLTYIYENCDSSFAFRWACGKGFCRCCVVSVNGKPVLSCMEPSSKFMKIEPHPKFKVIKDLMVDLGRLK